MDIGIIVVWISLLGYLLVVFKAKIVEKKERKWVYLLVIAALGFSLLVMLNISLNTVISFLNNTFEGISRMVVNIMRQKVSNLQLMFLVANFIFSSTFISLPQIIVGISGQHGWLIPLILWPIFLLIILMI